MSLSAALNIARSGLAAASGQTAIVSRNIANAHDPYYTRKTAELSTLLGGGAAIVGYSRAQDKSLLDKLLDASGSAAAKQALLDGLESLNATVGDPDSEISPAAMLGKFYGALQLYESGPGDLLRAQDAARAASDLATTLNSATATVQSVRQDADAGMASSVDRINSLLAQFKIANDGVVKGHGTAADITEYLDQRDKILRQLSEELGVRTVTGPHNDVAIYTDSGVTLFETNARTVSFERTVSYSAGTAGNAVFIDGVPVTGASAGMPVRSGRLVGLSQLRDNVAVTYQNQLDEIARGLIEAFAESDQSTAPSLPDATGLFIYSGSPAIPTTGTIIPGLAGDIRINPLADPTQGGNPSLVRDGGFNGAAYVYNSTGAAGFSDRIAQLVDALDASRNFDPTSGLQGSATLASFSSSSVGWLQASRQTASNSADYHSALATRAADALQRKTGVNIDEEMTIMLDLEKAYQASSKLITVIDSMFGALLNAV
jgi:flagellar hook-associated protein 1 FlgK